MGELEIQDVDAILKIMRVESEYEAEMAEKRRRDQRGQGMMRPPSVRRRR